MIFSSFLYQYLFLYKTRAPQACMYPPTMLPLIMASGLQKPRSVILPRFSPSSWNTAGYHHKCSHTKASATSHSFNNSWRKNCFITIPDTEVIHMNNLHYFNLYFFNSIKNKVVKHCTRLFHLLSGTKQATYQDVFQLDVPVHKSLAVQESNALHHIHSHLQSATTTTLIQQARHSGKHTKLLRSPEHGLGINMGKNLNYP